MSFAIAALGAVGVLLVYQGIVAEPRRMPRAARTLDRLIAEAGLVRLTDRELVAGCALAGIVAFAVVAGVTGSAPVAFAFAVGGAWAPIALLHGRRNKRRARLREAWPDAIATLIAAVRSGASLPEACASLTERGPLELRAGFNAFAATYRATGSFAAGLERMKARLADPVADRVVAALALAREVGGTDLVQVLRALGDFVRDDLRVRKEIEARWSWTITAARVAAAAPWVVLVLMATRPEAARAYATPTGALVIAGGAVATLVGYRLMLRAARLPEERRLGG